MVNAALAANSSLLSLVIAVNFAASAAKQLDLWRFFRFRRECPIKKWIPLSHHFNGRTHEWRPQVFDHVFIKADNSFKQFNRQVLRAAIFKQYLGQNFGGNVIFSRNINNLYFFSGNHPVRNFAQSNIALFRT